MLNSKFDQLIEAAYMFNAGQCNFTFVAYARACSEISTNQDSFSVFVQPYWLIVLNQHRLPK